MIKNPKAGDLRALFPGLYSRRDVATGTWWDRNWLTLQIPNIRLMGPLWSFAVTLKERSDSYEADTFLEHLGEEKFPGHNLDYAPPTVMRAEIDNLWNGDIGSRSRLNMVAVNTIVDGTLVLPSDDFTLLSKTSPLILAPFGRHPKHFGMEGNKKVAHLAAMQLVSGTVWLTSKHYLPVLRAALGLEEPNDDADVLALTPTGAGFRAKVTLPWTAKKVDGWLKLTLTDRGDDKQLSPELRIWTEPDGGQQWQQRLDTFLRHIDGAADTAKLQWFGLTARRQVRPEDVFWPCSFDASKPLPLLTRIATKKVSNEVRYHSLHLETAALEPSIQGQSGRALTMNAPTFEISRDNKDRIIIEAKNRIETPDANEKDMPPPRALNVAYAYANDAETVTLSGSLNFALPLQSNATRMREAVRFGEPPPAPDGIQKSPLWLFTPIADGWLHWPFPNATTALLADVADAAEHKLPVRQSVTAGNWFVGTSEDGTERAWSVSLFGAAEAHALTRLVEDGDLLRIESHKLEFTGLSGAIDGMLPVTAFAQASDQLLPEPQTRALAPTYLSAVTPDLLTGLESRLWQDGTLKAELSFRSLTMRPSDRRVALDGAPERLTVTWPDKKVPGDLSARIWVRHEKLPTLQTLPLCVAGGKRNEPSGTRELAPLKGAAPDARETGIAFAGRIDITAPHIDLDYNLNGGPQTGGWVHPLADAEWTNELGQVLPTLGSVTLFPGLSKGGRHAIEYKTGFGPVPDVTLGIDIGHGLATTYELHAFVTLPPPEEEEADEGPPPPIGDPIFRPGAWNVPGDAVWMAVWADLNRKLALSAIEKSELVSRNGNDYSLPNVVLDQEYALTAPPEVSTRIGFGERDLEWPDDVGGGESVAHFGELRLPIKDQPLTLRGLPSTEELSGLNVTLGRPGVPAPKAKIELGTLRSVRGDDEKLNKTVDQAGWGSGTPVLLAHAVTRPIVRYRKGATKDWHLMTCRAPVNIAQPGRPAISFGFCDLPCVEASGWTFEAQKAGDTHPLGTDDNPLQGYTWWLDQVGSEDNVMVGNLAFRPLHLRSVRLSVDGQPLEAVLTGRIAVPVQKTEGGEVLFANALGEVLFAHALGETILTISFNGGNATLQLTAEGPVELPLADPDRTWPPVPWVEVNGFHYTDGVRPEGKARLKASAPSLLLDLSIGGSNVASNSDEERRSLRVFAVEWELGELRHDGTWEVGNAKASVAVRASFDLNIAEDQPAKATVSASANLVTGDLGGHCDLALSNDWTSTIDIVSVSQQKSQKSGGLFDLLSFTGFASQFLSGPDAERTFCGIVTSAQRATIQLALRPKPEMSDGKSCAFFQIEASSLTARIQHIHASEERPNRHKVELVYTSLMPSPHPDDVKRVEDHAHVYVNLYAENDIFLPTIDVEKDTLRGPHLKGERFKHFAWVRTAGTRVKLSTLQRNEFRFAATVLHKVERNGDEVLRLELTQGVMLMSPNRADAEIGIEHPRSSSSVFGPGSKDANIHAHLDNTAYALPHGLSQNQIAQVKDGSVTGPAVFAGTHALVRDPLNPESGRLQHLPLPFLSVPGLESILVPEIKHDWQIQRLPQVPFDALDGESRAALAARVNEARDDLADSQTDFADQLIGAEAAVHRPMFIGRSEISKDNGASWEASDQQVPGAETGLLLSAWFPAGSTGAAEAYAIVAPAPDFFRFLRPPFAAGPGSVPYYTREALVASWTELPRAPRHLAPGLRLSGADLPTANPSLTVELFARTSDGLAITRVARTEVRPELDKGAEVLTARLSNWALIGLGQHAPWARSGHLVVRTALSVADPVLLSIPVFAGRRTEAINETTSVLAVGPRFAETHRVYGRVAMSGTAEQLLAGYRAVGSHPEVLTSEAERVLNEADTDARLTSVATVSAFALATPGTRHVFGPREAGWIGDRETMAPRPPTAYVPDTQPRLAPIRPPGTDLPRPAADHPSARSAPPRGDESTSRAFVPSSQIVASVGSRAGEFGVRRLGLAIRSDASKTGFAQAGDAVMATRSARPVILGVNDRTRAGSHEDGHFAASKTPEALVHGPGIPLTGLETVDEALLRTPRSRFAFTLALLAPEFGLVVPGVDGSIKLTVGQAFGDLDEATGWQVAHASIRVGAWRYVTAAPAQTFDIEPGKEIAITDFTALLRAEPGAPATAFDALARQPMGSEAELTLLLSGNGIVRVVTLPLFARSAAAPLIEAPVFLRFDDPEYNDLLSGLAIRFGDGELTLLTDRKEVKPDDFLVCGLSLSEIAGTFDIDEGKLRIHGVEVTIRVTLDRDGIQTTVKHTATPSVHSDRFATLGLPLFLLSGAAEPGDRLTVSVNNATAELSVKAEPGQLNPSGYGLIRLDMPKDGEMREEKSHASLPLYGRGSRATVIEMVDPRDMEFGRVRQRAMYRWHTFQHLPQDETSRLTLLKIGRTGSTWLPGSLRTGWLPARQSDG